MELSTSRPDIESGKGKLVRSSSLANLVAALVLTAMLGAGGALFARAEAHWIVWLVVAPLALAIGALLLLIAGVAWSSFLQSLGATNWLAYVRGDGVFLNLRSYRNGHFEGRVDPDDPTVVFVPHREITGIARVVETLRHGDDRQRATRRRQAGVERDVTIELRVDAPTDELERACFRERTREAPTITRFGIPCATKDNGVPVYVAAPGKVRVQWSRELFDALAERVRVEDEETVELDASLAELTPLERAGALVRRGKRFEAMRVLREEAAMDRSEAKAWVDGDARAA